MVAVSSWGRLSRLPHDVRALTARGQVASQIKEAAPGLAFGMGRSYGDVCLNPYGHLWTTTTLDRFIAFDEEQGLLRCEAGVLLRDIQRLFLPLGYSLPVTPGTQLITVGGAIANDVHGKNHHRRGTFGDHVEGLTLARTDGALHEIGPRRNEGLFAATLGGMGLTGVVVDATLRLHKGGSPWVEAENIPFDNVDAFLTLCDESEKDWEHTVAWVDCITHGGGRGIFMRGNPVPGAGLPPAPRDKKIPVEPPFSLVGKLSLRLFNALYYALRKSRKGRAIMPAEAFLYPLDSILEWNRIYGSGGFYQYQCVVPRSGGMAAVKELLKTIADAGEGSFLAVLKTFADKTPPGMLSFAQEGITLALDFPNRGACSLTLFARLDAIVRAAGGRLYLAKDARMSREFFEESYPRLSEFLPHRDPGISSAASRRLMGG